MKIKKFLPAIIVFVVIAAGCVGQAPQPGKPIQLPNATQSNITTPPSTAPIADVSETEGFDYTRYTPPEFNSSYPLLLTFPIMRSPMPYYVFNRSAINEYKYNVTMNNIRLAFNEWENATRYRVRFVRVFERPEEGIIIEMVPSLINFTAGSPETVGEASPIYYDYKNYSLIVGGEMQVFPLYGGSENRVIIVHEIGHILGLGHNSDSHSVLYPYNAYSQVITENIIEALDVLYQDVPVQNITASSQ